MTHPDAKDSLSMLVKQARTFTGKVLDPFPAKVSCDLLALDNDKMLSGLSPTEALTRFHPFGEAHLPSVELAGKDQVTFPEKAHAYPEGASQTNITTIHSEGDTSTTDEHHWLLNQSFSNLVEQVFRASNVSQSKPLQTNATRSQSRQPYGSLGGDIAPASLNSKDYVVKVDSPSAAPKPIVSPLFQQLETLVDHWQFSEASDYLNSNESALESTTRTSDSKPLSSNNPMKQLADLTNRIAVDRSKHSQHSMNPFDPQKNAKDKKAPVGIGIGSNRETIPSNNTTADAVKRSPNSHLSESVSGVKPLSVNGLEKNGFKVQGIEREQHAAMSALSVNGLTPLATQKMADALNDYLQEQAELHGVDL